MAANLQLLKRRIKTSNNISQIAKAMEMISASKIKRAQDATAANKPYASKINEVTKSLILSLKEQEYSHRLLEKNESSEVLLLVISPDKGLCGSLNANLYKKILDYSTSTKIIAVGRKAEQFCARRDYNLIASFEMGSTLPSYSTTIGLKNIIEDEYVSNKVGRVEILYSSFESFFVQVPIVNSLLPISDSIEGETSIIKSYIFEPDSKTILDMLIPYYLETQLFQALLEAYTSEQAARMMAMQNAKNSAHDIADYLTLSYNKLRQERITNEILDLNNSKILQ